MTDKIPILLGSSRVYDHHRIKLFCDEAADRLGLSKNFYGSTVLLKPNLISSRASRLACCDARFVRAVAEWCVDKGGRVQIGDSPSFGSAGQVMKKMGIAAEISNLDIEIVEFKQAREYHLSNGVKVGVSEEALACDVFVNIPRIKAHSQMYVTIAVKNIFGIVCGMRKAMCHMKNGLSHRKFGDLMLDLIGLLPDTISFVDGIEVMHKWGPVKGEPLNLGCLCAGKDPLAIDTLLLSLLELDPRRCPIWRAADARDFPGSRLDNLACIGEQLETFKGAGFQVPSILNPVPFNPFRFLVSSFQRAAASLNS